MSDPLSDLQLSDLHAEKQKAVERKMGLTLRLSEIKAECATRLPTRLFQKYCDERVGLIRELNEEEAKIGRLKLAINLAHRNRNQNQTENP